MFPINDYAEFQKRQAELLKEAENERLIRQAEGNRPETSKSWHLPTFQPGLQFMNWGRKLMHISSASHNRQHSTSFSPRSSSR